MKVNKPKQSIWATPLLLASLLGQVGVVNADPVLVDIEASREQLSLPELGDVFNVIHQLTYITELDTPPIAAVEVSQLYPDGQNKVDTYQVSGASLGEEGVLNIIQAFDGQSLRGEYQFSYRVIDEKGNSSDSNDIYLNIDHGLEVPLAITDFWPLSGIPGDVINVIGEGLDPTNQDISIFFGTKPASIVGTTSEGLEVQIPTGATSGPITALNSDGRVESIGHFKVDKSIQFANASSLVLAVGQSQTLAISNTGLPTSEVTWFVDSIKGGSAEKGFISSDGTYTAPNQIAESSVSYDVEIKAVSIHDSSLSSTINMSIVPPKRMTAPNSLVGITGGQIDSDDAFSTLSAEAGQLDGDLQVLGLSSTYLRGDEDLEIDDINGIPLMMASIELAESALQLSGEFSLTVNLPMALPPGSSLDVMSDAGDGYFDEGHRLYVGDDGVQGIITFNQPFSNMNLVVINRDARDWSTPAFVSADTVPPPGDIEEGMLLPVMIEGHGFAPDLTRVLIEDSSIAHHFRIFGVRVSPDGKRLGFTIHIRPNTSLDAGDALPVAFRVERLFPDGSLFTSVTTDPGDFVVSGLPELDVRAAAQPAAYTIDGLPLDEVIDGADANRFSTMSVPHGVRLGIGRIVGTVVREDTSFDLSCLEDFEAMFGTLSWVDPTLRQGNCTTQVQIFQPENRLVHLDVTGSVRIDGEIYLSGMRGGENSDPFDATGKRWMGGLAGGNISGGFGGDGGITINDEPKNGQLAGNNVSPSFGVGTRGVNPSSLSGGSVNVSPAGFGSRFDPQTVTYDDYIEAAVNVATAVVTGGTGETFVQLAQNVGSLFIEITGLRGTSQIANSQHVVAGQGGHGGLFGSSEAFMVEDYGQGDYLTPGSGGGGGGGGGSSFYQETLFDIPMLTEKTIGGGGAGGGGAAGALRITSGGSLIVTETAKIRASGGRGGHGEAHTFLGSPGGGGGGGAGGLLKLQGIQLSAPAHLDVSGGERSGAEIAHGLIDVKWNGYRPRIQVLNGQAHGAIMTFGWPTAPGIVPNEVEVLWPTGRPRWPTQGGTLHLPDITGIYGLGEATAIPNPLSIFSPNASDISGLLVIDQAKKIHLMTEPQFLGTSPDIFNIHMVADLATMPALNGWIPSDVTQIPSDPDRFYVAGLRGSMTEIHAITSSGIYEGLIFSIETSIGSLGTVAHLKDLDSLSDGRLLILMTPLNSAEGVYAIDVATGATQRISTISADSMSVLRGTNEDVIYVMRHDTCVNCDDEDPSINQNIYKYNVQGTRVSSASLVHETISQPGSPGLIRLDGSRPGVAPSEIKYDFWALKHNRFNGADLVFHAPTIASFDDPNGRHSVVQSLVYGDKQLPTRGRGAEANDTANLWLEGPNGMANATMSKANNSGVLHDTLTLEDGYSHIWFEHNKAGKTPELLRRRVLLLEGATGEYYEDDPFNP